MLSYLKRLSHKGGFVILLFFICCCIIQWTFSPSIAMVFFITVFQIFTGYNVVKGFLRYKKSRKGPFIIGELVEIKEFVDEEDKQTIYVGIIEFNWPSEGDKQRIEYADKGKMKFDKPYKISVNRADPSKSIAMAQFDELWWFNKILWVFILGVLGFVSYFRIRQHLGYTTPFD